MPSIRRGHGCGDLLPPSSTEPQAIPLVRPEDLMRLERGHTLNLIEPCPWPLLARVPVYPQTPYGAGLDPNPYYRG